MTETLKCPECSAPLDQPAEGAQTVRCRYCNCTILLDRPYSRGTSDIRVVTSGQRAEELTRILEQARAGNLIEAIRIYRSVHGSDLRTAKQAVEAMLAGRALNPTNSAISPRPTGSRGPLIAVIFVAILIPFLIVMLSVSTHPSVRAVKTAVPKFIPPPMPTTIELPEIFHQPPPPVDYAKLVSRFGRQGMGPGQFKDIRSIAVDGQGRIYVGESTGGRIQVFDSDGKFLKLWQTDPKNSLITLSADRQGNLIACAGGKIICYEAFSGRAFGEAQSNQDDRQVYYSSACYSLAGDIYALDYEQDVYVLNGTGQIQRRFSCKEKSGEDELNLSQIAVSGNGQIYVSDQKKGIFQFANDGRYINRFGAGENDDNPLDRRSDTLHFPQSIAVDGQGRVYVADLNPAIKVFDSSGRFLGSMGNYEVCFGLAVTDADELVGCFRNDYEVRKYLPVKK